MAENKGYLAVGEEATRGTKEASTVGFIPLVSFGLPEVEQNKEPRNQFRGEDSLNGDTDHTFRSESFTFGLEMPMYAEAGTVVGMGGTIFKHFHGKVTSAQNGATLQYYHMMYSVPDMYSTSNLDTKALTLNYNLNEEATMKNYPYVGARVSELVFNQEAGSDLIVTANGFGQKRVATTAEIGSPAFAGEELAIRYNELSVYTGTITRVGSAPDYTDFTFGSATQLCPDNITVTLTNGIEDVLRLCGQTVPDKTRRSDKARVTVSMTIDWATSGFDSVAEFNAWLDTPEATTNLFLHWDTGTQAEAGDNYSLYLDLPQLVRTGSNPEYATEATPMITLEYTGEVSATTTYNSGLMIKNTATAV